MKKIYLLPLLLLFLGCTSGKKEASKELSVMSFNIRMDNKEDSLNWWGFRKHIVQPFLREQMPDVIGAQEVLYTQLVELSSMLPSYQYIGVGREDGKNKGEFSPLFYNPKRLKLLESGWFWLSETPEEPSFGWDAACERIATWALFERQNDGKQIAILNTHLDHKGEVARANSSAMIKEWANRWDGSIPVIVLGDFNAIPSSPVVQSLTTDLKDSYLEAPEKEGADWTFHDFGKRPIEKRTRIDYILYKGAIAPLSYINFDQPKSAERNFWMSDHTPILARFELE